MKAGGAVGQKATGAARSRWGLGHRHHGRHPEHGPSMVVRVFWLLLLGLLLAAAITGGVAWWRIERTLPDAQTAISAQARAVQALVLTLDALPAARRPQALALAEQAGMPAELGPATESGEGALTGGLAINTHAEFDSDEVERRLAASRLADSLFQGLQRPVLVQPLAGPERDRCGALHFSSGPCYRVRVQLADGSTLAVLLAPRSYWRGAPEHWALHGVWVIALAALFGLAAVITRVALSPLRLLTQAADRFAADVDAPALPERGPREIRRAVSVFNRMQTRIRAHLVERTSMLAAIAHDLQTPLTRLRLRLEDLPEGALRTSMAADLEDCRARVTEGLELARSIDDRSPLQDVDLAALLRSACDEAADAGGDVELAPVPVVVVRARPQALLRCVENLVGNAVKYGAQARVRVDLDGAMAHVTVRDRGPGIPEADLERVFEPFVRLETSRSRATGGTGLGLYIVRNLIERQGGAVRLRNLAGEPGGGLEATITVPLAAVGQARS